MQLWIPENLKIKTKLYNSRIQWHKTLQAGNGDIEKKDKTRGSKSEPRAVSRGVLWRVSAAVSGRHSYCRPPGLLVWYLTTAYRFPWNVPGAWHLQQVRSHLQVLYIAGANWRVFSFCHWLPGLPSFTLRSRWVLYDLILQSIFHV